MTQHSFVTRSVTPYPAVETGDPLLDKLGFRRALGQYATGVTVISTLHDGQATGLTCNSFASLSLDPPLVSWALRRESISYAAFGQCTHFAVNVLAVDQTDMSQRFSKPGPGKFDNLAWSEGLGGAPLLGGTAASFECRREALHDAGDHLLVIGRVERFSRFERPVLLFAQGRYGVGVDHPDAVRAAASTGLSAPFGEELMTSLCIRAYAKLTPDQGAALRLAGLTLLEGRMMRAIQISPGSTLEELQPELLFGFGAGELMVNELAGRRLVRVEEGRRLFLSDTGQAIFAEVLARAEVFERESLASFSSDELATTRRVLAGLARRKPVPR